VIEHEVHQCDCKVTILKPPLDPTAPSPSQETEAVPRVLGLAGSLPDVSADDDLFTLACIPSLRNSVPDSCVAVDGSDSTWTVGDIVRCVHFISRQGQLFKKILSIAINPGKVDVKATWESVEPTAWKRFAVLA
jgi:hypothetical protein